MLTILMRLLILAVIGYILYRFLWRGDDFGLSKLRKRKKSPHPQAPLEEMKKDPVCGTYIPEKQAIKHRVNGETYFFCSLECQKKFLEEKKK